MYAYHASDQERNGWRGRAGRRRLGAGGGLAVGLALGLALALFAGACGAGSGQLDQPDAEPSVDPGNSASPDGAAGDDGQEAGSGDSGSGDSGGDGGDSGWWIDVTVTEWHPSFGCAASGTIALSGWPEESGMGLPVSFYWEVERPLGPGGPVEFQPFGDAQDVSFLEDGLVTVTSPELPDPHQSSIVRLRVVSVPDGDITSEPVVYPSCPNLGLTR